eukprot:TRINITY_DN4997_c0_g1_i1.p1 TRINITY_DN4997_c0_g1~~TRINITY_DN4997_c0_g1_i1.p1  ORF type:complete len:190 (-),score=94.22 TRINITY_DN4997_c0_g1_i1:53-622(-)
MPPGPPTFEGVIGRWNSAPYPVWSLLEGGNGVRLSMSNGDDCVLGGMKKPRVATMDFPCSKAAGKMAQVIVQEVALCTYVLTIPTSLSCPDDSMSHGTEFVLMFSLVVIIYLGAGAFYRYTRVGARGIDMIPHLEFWRVELPSLVDEGIRYSTYKAKQLYAQWQESRSSELGDASPDEKEKLVGDGTDF